MIQINENFQRLQGSYLFSEVGRRIREYQANNPDKKVIRLSIGDVTQPLAPTVVQAMREAVEDMSKMETFRGYPPEIGYDFLRNAIKKNDFEKRGVSISEDEICISTGAKEDTANIQELFSANAKIAITDPVYPVYSDSNVMAGRSGEFTYGRYRNYVYLDCNEENGFVAELPKEKVELIYLCSPNNPTGSVMTKDQLKTWVDYAHRNKAFILFDAAYEAYIRQDDLPHSIFEIEGAKEVAIEFRSLSKTAGFTGTRCAYTIIPKEAKAYDANGKAVSLLDLWTRRQSTKFNGVAYVIQRGAAAVFTEQGQTECKKIIDYYLENARLIAGMLESIGLKYYGAKNSPYIWHKTPGGMDSWKYFDTLLEQIQLGGTPGVGFGKNGQGFFRLTSFGRREDVLEAMERFKRFKI